MLRKAILLPWLFVALLFAGCASLGLDADTFNKKLAAGYTTIDAAAQSATVLLHEGKIDEKERRYVVTMLNTAIDGLDAANAVGKTDPAAGQAKLNAALVALTTLQAFLASKGATP